MEGLMNVRGVGMLPKLAEQVLKIGCGQGSTTLMWPTA